MRDEDGQWIRYWTAQAKELGEIDQAITEWKTNKTNTQLFNWKRNACTWFMKYAIPKMGLGLDANDWSRIKRMDIYAYEDISTKRLVGTWEMKMDKKVIFDGKLIYDYERWFWRQNPLFFDVTLTLGDNDNCPICIEKMEGDKVQLPCGHQFHKNCIDQWMQSNETCPYCRAETPLSTAL